MKDLTVMENVTPAEREHLTRQAVCAWSLYDEAAAAAVFCTELGSPSEVRGYCLRHARKRTRLPDFGRVVPLSALIEDR